MEQVARIDYYCSEETKVRQANHQFYKVDFVMLKENLRKNLVQHPQARPK